jgi:flagellin-like protein
LLNKRGISEVVGALLMIALAITGGIIVYVYSSGLIGSLQGSKVQQPYSEHIALDYYQWNMESSTDGTLTLDLRNTGSTHVILADFFIASNPVTPCFGTGCSAGPDLNVNTPAMNVTLTYSGLNFAQGVSYNIRVVTATGAVFDFACIAGATS